MAVGGGREGGASWGVGWGGWGAVGVGGKELGTVTIN